MAETMFTTPKHNFRLCPADEPGVGISSKAAARAARWKTANQGTSRVNLTGSGEVPWSRGSSAGHHPPFLGNAPPRARVFFSFFGELMVVDSGMGGGRAGGAGPSNVGGRRTDPRACMFSDPPRLWRAATIGPVRTSNRTARAGGRPPEGFGHTPVSSKDGQAEEGPSRGAHTEGYGKTGGRRGRAPGRNEYTRSNPIGQREGWRKQKKNTSQKEETPLARRF